MSFGSNHYPVRLTSLPRTPFSFAAREMATRLKRHRSMLETFYRKFDWTKNPKQQAVYNTLSDPLLPARTRNRIQYICLRGSVGSGKSTMSIAWPIMQMHKYPNATWLCMRRTEPQIMGSIFDQIKKFCATFRIPNESKMKSSSGPAEIRFPNGSKFVFWSSQSVVEDSDADNARGLGSMEYSGATVEEADKVHKQAIDTIPQRLREKTGIKPRVMFMNINPTHESHWIAKMFRDRHKNEHPEDYHDFHFTMYDNEYWLEPGYIESQYSNFRNNPGLFRRFVLGEWGPEINGIPIYGSYFRRTLSEGTPWHVAGSSFAERWVRDQLWNDGDLCLCWDFGYHHPCLVVFQDVRLGDFQQIRVLYCALGDNTTLGVFANYVLGEVQTLFPGANYATYCDPAGKQKDPRGVTAASALDVLRKLGLHPIALPSSEAAGVELIIDILQRSSNNKNLGIQPEIVVEPNERYTGDFINMMEIGFAQPYGEELSTDKLSPIDDKYHIHIADAFRYGVVHRRKLLRATPTTSYQDMRVNYSRNLDDFGMASNGLYLPTALALEDTLDYGAYYGFADSAFGG